MFENEYGRVRGWRKRSHKKDRRPGPSLAFQNPFPYMSDVEARVYLWLWRQNVPFSWRYFDGEAPNFQELLPGFTPEFTLSEYKLVILILGMYYGQLPGVLDKNALAQATLEYDGWKVVVLWEMDVVRDVNQTMTFAVPELVHPAITGPPKANPLGITPDYVSARRTRLSGVQLRKRKFFDPTMTRDSHDRAPDHRRPNRNRDRRTRNYGTRGR